MTEAIRAEVGYPRLLPCHPKPRPDELLSSWIVRTAAANRIAFDSLPLGGRFFKIRDADVNLSGKTLECLSKSTGISSDRIRQLSLMSFRGVLFENNPPNAALPPWILPIRTKGFCGVQCCPQCLLEKMCIRDSWRRTSIAKLRCHLRSGWRIVQTAAKHVGDPSPTGDHREACPPAVDEKLAAVAGGESIHASCPEDALPDLTLSLIHI